VTKRRARIRISAAERDSAMSALGEHFSTGRLELSEYEDRCGPAVAARTRADLEELFDDLPEPHPDLSSATPPARRAGLPVISQPKDPEKSRETPASEAMGVVAGLGVVVGIPGAILLTIFLGMWWMFIPVVAFVMVAGGLSEHFKKPRPTGDA
jgi:hypothetical protein